MARAPSAVPETKVEQNGSEPAGEPWLAAPLSDFQDIEEILGLVMLAGQKAERTLNKIRQHVQPATQQED